jgi:hypothetical protein
MKKVLAVLGVLAFATIGVCNAADTENPYKNAKVGDWVSYVQTANAAAMNMKTTVILKQKVKAKDEKEVTLAVETEVDGEKMPNSEIKIPLDQPFDQSTVALPRAMNAKVEKIADGKESITVAGKSYDCQWCQVKVSMKNEQMDMTGTAKSWVCAAVPLSGLVKSEAERAMTIGGNALKTQLTMELKDFGRGQ